MKLPLFIFSVSPAIDDGILPTDKSNVINCSQSCDPDLHIPNQSRGGDSLDKAATVQDEDVIVNTTAIEQSMELTRKLTTDSICEFTFSRSTACTVTVEPLYWTHLGNRFWPVVVIIVDCRPRDMHTCRRQSKVMSQFLLLAKLGTALNASRYEKTAKASYS